MGSVFVGNWMGGFLPTWIGDLQSIGSTSSGAYGGALLIALQVFINVGVNTGLLPTKGLTLPLMSYGGSSLIICCMSIGLLLRIHYECDVHTNQAVNRNGSNKNGRGRKRRRRTAS